MQKNPVKTLQHKFSIKNFEISELSTSFILSHSTAQTMMDHSGFFDIHPQSITLNEACFTKLSKIAPHPEVEAILKDNTFTISCTCNSNTIKLCEHQAQVLFNIMQRPEFKIFFDDALRLQKVKEAAAAYGLDNESNLEDYFLLEYLNKSVEIKPKLKELFPIRHLTTALRETQVIPHHKYAFPGLVSQKGKTKMVLVIGQHRFYKHLSIGLFEAETTQKGTIKNPLKSLDAQGFIWKTEQHDVLKFFTAVAGFQNNYDSEVSEKDIEALKALVKNPVDLEVFYHNPEVSENITASTLVSVKLSTLPIALKLSINEKDNFYEVNGQITAGDQSLPLDKVKLKFSYFILVDKSLQLIDNYDFLRVIAFFKQYSNKLLIHQSKFEEFRNNFLSRLEHKIQISYAYLKPATKEQLHETGLDRALEKIIYLSDSEDYVIITPVMKYGNIEVPVFSRKQVYLMDLKGEPFTVPRDEEAELDFTNRLMNQHPDFEEQVNGQLNRDHFYLHKTRFLNENWFLEAFEVWQQQEITVLGFNKLNDNKYNPNKAIVSVAVSSGVNWFDTTIDLRFGNQKVSLKHLQKAVKNNNRFVPLGDGTLGMLPSEWIEKFSKYFNAGEIVEDRIRTPRINFSGVRELYESEVLSKETKEALDFYYSKFSKFEAIEQVKVPAAFKGTLRDYQKHGLNWLNFLDEFNFGGCLADDMGLGKTIQVIAFILSQRDRKHTKANLVVVPTSLIFNWQAEVAKYAPSMKILTIHGSNRLTDTANFNSYEIILTTYGTLLSDIRFLKKFNFNYIFLDESQAIKNPESQRYKAARLLQSRNKILLTGTPIENNTFDLYGQLSFACPGLLGSKQYFKQHYSTPIDKFKDSKRAFELQQKVNPFILRRTKEQVAKELPDKTEIVIYCEMGIEQRRVYDAYSKQFKEFLEKKKDDEVSKHSLHVLQGFTKLRQICNAPALLADEQSFGESSAKIEVLMEQIENKSPHHKILIFSQFVTMLDLIKKALDQKNIAYQYLTGQTKDRAAEVESFQNKQDIRVFLISLKAGGTGLNLTAADYVYLVDPWWNPAVERQAIDRSHRIGQKKKVVAVRLICPNTIEEKMMALQESKTTLASDLIRTDSSILKSLTKAELLKLFR